jgi:fibronectin type 3 domain-containing protein
MPIEAGGVIYTGCKRGYITAASPTNGATLWQYEAGKGYMFTTVTTGAGVVIAATQDGRISAIADESAPWPVDDLEIEKSSSNQIRLDWSPRLRADEYRIYRGVNDPEFVPGGFYATTANTYFEDASTGDTANNYYYLVTTYNTYGESDESNRVGEFDLVVRNMKKGAARSEQVEVLKVRKR